MERHHHNTSVHHNKKDAASFNGSQISNASSSHPKKWSFGRLFRKKKEIESGSSSEEDRKAGFMSSPKYTRDQKNHNNKSKSKSKNNRGSKLIGAGFDHIVVNPGQQQQQSAQPPPVKRQPQPHRLGNEFFLPFESATNEPFYQNQQQQQLHRHQLHPPIFYQQQYLQNPQQHQPQFSRSSNSLDRRAAAVAPHSSKHQSQSTQRLATADSQLPLHSSSEEELISLNSSTFAKYRSDESIHSGGQGGQNAQSRRSRAARNQRYYKRLSRDGEVSHGQVPIMHAPQPTQRWKTQPVPLSLYSPSTAQSSATQPNQLQSTATQRLQNAGSLQHVTPYVQWGQVQQQPKNLQNSVNASKRSISYDSHIHLQKANGNLQTKPLPPPPPPRDPTRRVNINGSSCELRPLSYAFDTVGVPVFPDAPLNGRCESDDKIWASQTPLYQSAQSLDVNPNHSRQPQTPSQRRFITRSERNAQPGKKSLPNGLDIRYVTDGTPRSRKPIHLLEYQDIDGPPPSSGVLRTTKSGLPSRAPKAVSSNFWKRLDGAQKQCEQDSRWLTGTESAQTPLKPRSASSSRISELRTYPIPMYSEVRKPNRRTQPAAEPQAPPQVEVDEVDNVVCGSLHIRPSQDATRTFVEIQNKDVNKSHSMPNYYQHQSSGYASAKSTKYDEYGTEKRERYCNMVPDTPVCPLPNPSTPQPKAYSQPAEPTHFPYKKPNNLEEAITELEAIYKSLKIGDEPVVVRKERVPTPSEFDKFALAHADSYDDDDSPTGDPDPVRDDVAYRNMMLSKLQHKTSEKQPPFGIPVGPIVPSPHNDYLHVTPNTDRKKTIPAPKKVPDIVKDDLAVRALRKDASSCKHEFAYPTGSLQRKNRATRTQSANIYALIQRDAAKPSGGDLFSYMELTKSIDRSGSVSNLQRGDSPADIPSTLQLLRNLKEQDLLQSSSKKAHLPFRHPSQGGAICQLPEKLTSASKEDIGVLCKPVPLPRSSITPESTSASHRLEDALNKIAKDAQDSSAKLSKELQELRKEALITSSRPKMCKEKDSKFEKGLEELEAVSEAAKHCGKMLLDTLPDTTADSQAKSRKLHKEGKLIQAIDQVSEAANAVCEKILKDMVGTESTAADQDSSKVQKMSTTKPLAMPNLMKNLAPVKSEQIEAIAERCMRQINELTEMPNCENPAEHCADLKAACNDANAQRSASSTKVDANLLSTVAEKAVSRRAKRSKQIEEIDRIMQECEARVRSDDGDAPTVTTTSGSEHLTTDRTTASSLTSSCGNSSHSAQRNAVPNTSASSFSSSSDNLAKSSNSSAVQRQSSSITSFNPYSSSDYIKSPSSEYHAPSTDPIKTFSTTSYDVQSTSITPNMNTSTFSYSPSPPLNLTPVAGASGEPGSASNREKSSSPSQYNSSEELAMIFGIEERPKQQQQQQKPQQGHNLQQLVHADGTLV